MDKLDTQTNHQDDAAYQTALKLPKHYQGYYSLRTPNH